MITEYLKQKKNLKSKKLFIFIVLLSLINSLYAKSGEDHITDMLEVLGLYSVTNWSQTDSNYQKLKPLFTLINDFIDNYQKNYLYDNLKKEFPYFDWGIYGHRLINHWGFDLDTDIDAEGAPTINQYPYALAYNFEKKFRDSYGDQNFIEAEWNRFLKYIREVQVERNLKLINDVRQTLGTDSSISRNIAAILYYTHLLGDHIEHEGVNTGESVLEVHKIIKNLAPHIKSLSKNCSGFYIEYISSIAAIKSLSNEQQAKKVLAALKKHIPEILKFQYEGEFTSKNLKFCFDEDLDIAA